MHDTRDGQGADEDFGTVLEALIRQVVQAIPNWRRGRTTDVVHSTWIRVIQHPEYGAKSQDDLLRLVTRAARNQVIDEVRYARAAKRTPPAAHVTATGDIAAEPSQRDLRLDELDALDRLVGASRDAAVVFIRCACGETQDEIAEDMGVSKTSVYRLYKFAKAFLRKALGVDEHDAGA